jgi:hypothetical protein
LTVVSAIVNSSAICLLRYPSRMSRRTSSSRSVRGTRRSAIHHQLDCVDVGGIVGGKEEDGFGEFFGPRPIARAAPRTR